MADTTFSFSQLGLASILGQNQLAVPPNQRDYSWTVREVKTLFQDFARSIADDDTNYFLGTIVTIPRAAGRLEVVDGQQRLATTAIMLAEIRNYLKELDPMIAQSIDEEILTVIDRSTRARVPRLRLNLDDNDYFRARLTNASPVPSPSKPSHELIDQAFGEARSQVRRIVSGFDEKDHGDTLDRWINFMQQRARAILLQVPHDADAYRMFETLNDRGLRTSQSDRLPLAHRGAMNTGGNEARRIEAPCRSASDLTVVLWRRVALHTHRYYRRNRRRGGTRPGPRRLGCAGPFAAVSSPKARVGERCRAGAAGLRTAEAARVRRGRWAWGRAASS